MTLEELKAQAYDVLATIEAHGREIEKLKEQLMNINKQIGEEANKPKEVPVEEVKG